MRSTFSRLSLLFLSAVLLLPATVTAQQAPTRVKLTQNMHARHTTLGAPAQLQFPTTTTRQQVPLRVDGSNIVLYGDVIYSEGGLSAGVYSFPAQPNAALTKVYSDYNFRVNGGAVLLNGNYYLFNGEDYGDGISEVTVYVYDTESWEEIDELSFQPTCFPADLAVDPTDNKVYGIFASGNGTQELGTINLTTGQRPSIGELEKNLVALAIDATGLIFGIGEDGVLYRVSKDDASLTSIGATGIRPYYIQSATFDLATNRLFWATTTSSNVGALYEVSTQRGAATLVSTFPGNEEVVGLYTLSEAQPWEGGPDTPVAPAGLTIDYTDGVVMLTWTAPEKGIHGETLDASALTYTVTRYPGAVVVADGISETTFSETFTPEELTAFYYTVVAHNGELTGDAAQTTTLTAGSGVSLPYVQSFDDPITTALLTTIDGDRDGSTWTFQTDKGVAFLWGAPFENTNDWFVSPELKLSADYTYRVRLKAWSEWAANYPYNIAAYVGTGATTNALRQQIFSRSRISSDDVQQFDELFTITADGSYYVGIRANGYDLSSIYADDFIIEQGPKTTAPARVADLTATPDAQGGASVELTFTAPTQSLNGEALTALDQIVVRRDGQLIGTIDNVAVGQQLIFTDHEASINRNNTYTVAAVSSDGEGQLSEIIVWVGFDAPTEPLNVALKDVNGQAVLSWDAPQVGQNGGVVNVADLYYGVVRNDGSIVASQLQATTFAEDIDQTGQQRWLIYGVQAANTLGYSTVAQSNGIIAGAPYTLPFYEGFANGGRTNFWGAEDYNSQGWGATWGGYYDEDSDGNGGCIAFGTSGGYENSGSRLFTGKISLKGANSPILEYDYNHRSESWDGLGTPLRVYIVKNSTDTVLVKENEAIYFWQIDLNNVFTHERVSLDEFKDADYIQVLFDVVNAGTTYTYLDAVQVRDQVDNDLSISLTAAESAASGTELTATATVKNIGRLEAGAFSVSLYDADRLVETQEGTALAANTQQVFTFTVPVTTLKEQLQLQAVVDFAADEALANNGSDVLTVNVELPIYPAPELATATNSDDGVSLTWTAPEYSDFAVPTTDDVESYEPYVVTTFGDWTTVDLDGLPTHDDIYAGYDHVEYDAAGQPTSWLVFNPVIRNYETTDWWGESNGWEPVSGQQFFVAVAAADGTSDDWLISPELTGDAQTITFYEHGYYNMETFQVLYSTTDTNPESFVLLASETSSYDWTLRSYQLPAGAKFFAIRNTTEWGYRLFVDDITFQSAAGAGGLELLGYNIYRDGQLVGTATDADFTDTEATNGQHVYQVTALYNLGESAAATTELSVTTGIATVSVATHQMIFTLDGRRQSSLQHGVNIVKNANGDTRKVVVK